MALEPGRLRGLRAEDPDEAPSDVQEFHRRGRIAGVAGRLEMVSGIGWGADRATRQPDLPGKGRGR